MDWIWDGEKVTCGTCGGLVMVMNAERPKTRDPYVVASCGPCLRIEELPTDIFAGYEYEFPRPDLG